MVLLMQIVEEKSRNLGDDIASLLLTSTVRDDDGDEVALTHEQVAYRLLELTIAGHETTAKLIANGVVASRPTALRSSRAPAEIRGARSSR